MALYTDDSIERLRQAVDMADLVGAKTELRRSGQQLMGCCPFHDERTPSFSVDPDRKVFHCFGCGEGGDLFKFVELTEGLGFREAVEHLADRYGVQLELTEEDPRAAERRKERDRLLELLERTASWYVRLLWESDEAADSRRYLLGRGLDEQQLREFRVGYAPSAWDGVLLASRRNGFSEEELYDAGLVRRGRSGQLYDYFRRRITFPLCDARGRVLGFGGRAVGADQQPKYVNSTDNVVYHKGRHLFGADLARAAAAKAGQVVLCEGYTDVIALHQAGLRNTVGLMGTALTDEQVTELARLAPVVVLALDADSAGQEAMLRAAKVASGRRLELRVVSLPEGSDPADVVASEGAEGMRERVGASVPFIRFRVERELARGDLASAEGKDLVVDALKPVFADIPPSAMRDELVELVAEQVGVGAAKLTEWLAQPPRTQAAPARHEAAPAPQPQAPCAAARAHNAAHGPVGAHRARVPHPVHRTAGGGTRRARADRRRRGPDRAGLPARRDPAARRRRRRAAAASGGRRGARPRPRRAARPRPPGDALARRAGGRAPAPAGRAPRARDQRLQAQRQQRSLPARRPPRGAPRRGRAQGRGDAGTVARGGVRGRVRPPYELVFV